MAIYKTCPILINNAGMRWIKLENKIDSKNAITLLQENWLGTILFLIFFSVHHTVLCSVQSVNWKISNVKNIFLLYSYKRRNNLHSAAICFVQSITDTLITDTYNTRICEFCDYTGWSWIIATDFTNWFLGLL